MNQSTRQRVVGTIVLLLAATVVLPAVLDGSGVPTRNVEDRIPARPVTDAEPLEVTPRRPTITADTDDLRLNDEFTTRAVEQDRPASAPAPAETESDGAPTQSPAAAASSAVTEDRRPALEPATGLPEAWSVQLGAFSNPANVEALVERLKNAGHAAYTRPIESSSGSLTGVYVGPLVDRDTATDLQAGLQSSYGLAGRVIRYRIEEQ